MSTIFRSSRSGRQNTVISQSFIASDFQGFNDNINRVMKASGMMNNVNTQQGQNGFGGQPIPNNLGGNGLNQMMKAKQVYASRFMQPDGIQGQVIMGESKMFGFNNLTSTSEEHNNNSFQNQSQFVGYQGNFPQNQSNIQQHRPSQMQQINPNQALNRSIYAQQQQFQHQEVTQQQLKPNHMQVAKHQSQLVPPQKPLLQQRYVSPLVGKMDTPQKRESQVMNQKQQQQLQNLRQQNQIQMRRQSQQIYDQQAVNVQARYKNSLKKGFSFQNQSQQFLTSQTPQIRYQDQFRLIKQQQIKQERAKQKRQSINLNRTQAYTSSATSFKRQSSYLNLNNLQQSASSSNLMRKLKLNISQQFSNSFTLQCVKQPQRSNIIQMKKRQREFRKAIQNFII